MNRRETTLGLLLAAGSVLTVRAQQPAKVARVGVLGNNLATAQRAVDAFERRLAELGYVDGRNVVVEYRSADGNPDRLPGLAAELVARNVDVIVATGGAMAAVSARKATATIPIVFIAVGDPVGLGLVASLARPGGNVTGLSSQFPDAVPKLLQYVGETLPRATRVALLIDAKAPSTGTAVKAAASAAQAVRMSLHVVEVQGGEDFAPILEKMAKASTDALIVFGSPTILGRRKELADVALKHRMPLVSALREYVDAGGLMSYGPSLAGMFVEAANYADQILKGKKPGEISVRQPKEFELVINRKTAEALGITIPRSVLESGPTFVE